MKSKWGKKMLGEICSFSNGLWTGKKPPFIEVQVIRNTNFTKDGWLDLSDVVTLQVEKSQFEKRRLQIGDIILEKSGGGPKQPVGRVVLFEQETGDYSFSNFTSVIRINDQQLVDYQFLHKFLYKEYISGATEKMQTHSTGIRNLKFDEYKEIEVPIPSRNEQQRIVTLLDEAFEAIDQAKANTERNLQNARELFQSELNGIFTNKGEGWVEEKFGDVITTLTDYHANGSYEVLKENVTLKDSDDHAWMVRSTDFENNFCNDLKFIDRKGYEFLKKSKIYGGEIIISKIGNAGKVYLMPKINRPCSLAMNLFLIRVDDKKIYNEFVYLFLKSTNGDSQIKSRLLGTTTKTITKDNVRSIVIPYPKDIEVQQSIINQLNAILFETKQLEENYRKKLESLEELKKSILQKAFSGELTWQTTEIQMEQLDLVAEEQAKYQS